MKILDMNRVGAIKVQFKDSIFEDDFPEKGMVAWLTDVRPYICDGKMIHYELFFDFTDFEKENDKYLKEIYYENIHTQAKVNKGEIEKKELYTAKEAGMYSNKYSVYFGDLEMADEGQNECWINEKLKVFEV